MSVDAALRHLRIGSAAAVATAVAELDAAAGEGVADAFDRLATLAAAGVGMPQSWAVAFDHLERAASLGSASARGQLAVLADDGGRIRLDDWTAPREKRVLNASPRTVAIAGFLPAAVCRWLIGRAEGRLAPALTFGNAGRAAADQGRSNSALELGITETDVVVLLTRLRIAAAIGVPSAALEGSQILHYATGQAFALHADYLDPRLAEVAQRGQRMVTFLIYLNDAFDGGETDFPRLGLRHRGATGDALYFANLDASGAPDPRTLHAGLAPTRGEKWLFSQWVRNMARV